MWSISLIVNEFYVFKIEVYVQHNLYWCIPMHIQKNYTSRSLGQICVNFLLEVKSSTANFRRSSSKGSAEISELFHWSQLNSRDQVEKSPFTLSPSNKRKCNLVMPM